MRTFWDLLGVTERLQPLEKTVGRKMICACEDKMSLGRWYRVQAKVNDRCGAKHPKLTYDRILICYSKNARTMHPYVDVTPKWKEVSRRQMIYLAQFPCGAIIQTGWIRPNH